jgi:acylphosphatase
VSRISESDSKEHVARRAVIFGRVQGVWFRDFTRHRAVALGVAGWARNCADGSVEVWAEGPRNAVAALLDYCRVGPPRASVQDVHVDEVTPSGIEGFQVC